MANAVDLLTLAEGKRAVNLTGDSQNTELASYITAVSHRIDGLCGPVVNRTITSESHDGGCGSIWLRKFPVYSVTAVHEYSNTNPTVLALESNTTKTANDYLLDTRLGRIIRRASNSHYYFTHGANNVVVTYVAGRGTSSSVTDNFKQAAAIMLSNLWRKEQGGGTVTFGGNINQGAQFVSPALIPTFSVPNAVLELLADELLPPRVG